MTTLLALALLGVAGFVLLAILAVVGLVLKVLLWTVLFPLRLAFKLLFGLLGVALAVIAAPIAMFGGALLVIGIAAAGFFALILPLVPVLLVALAGWAIYRASSRRRSAVI